MIKVDQTTLETIKAQMGRDGISYLKMVFDKMQEENPYLLHQILETADCFVDNLLELRESDPDEFAYNIKLNILMYCLSVYHCINSQQEINELEKLYGK